MLVLVVLIKVDISMGTIVFDNEKLSLKSVPIFFDNE